MTREARLATLVRRYAKGRVREEWRDQGRKLAELTRAEIEHKATAWIAQHPEATSEVEARYGALLG
jgi:hypothetical protein